jgi:2-keto-3-deoxy-L-rhamnonate aldolase RhmA
MPRSIDGPTEGKSHWLEVDYHLQDAAHKILVLQMQKRDYIRILDAVKAHTGVDVDLEGNANKRH